MSIPNNPQQTLSISREDSNKFIRPSHIDINFQKKDKITFIKHRNMPFRISRMDQRFIRTPEVSELIKELHDGSWPNTLLGNMVFL